MTTPPPEEVELNEILDAIEAEATYSDSNAWPTSESLEKTKQALLRWREAYADKARIDELENRLPFKLVDEVYVLDEERLHNRISALRKQQEDK